MLKGFKAFILRGNAVDLAVGVVVGAAFGSIVTALVKDLITPFIAALVKAPDFSGIFFTIHGSRFLIGDFLNALISFLIIACTVYFFVVLPLNKLIPKPTTTKKCPECLSEIPIGAKRCSHCAVALKS
jgi:large conductance mechanosensitive channel